MVSLFDQSLAAILEARHARAVLAHEAPHRRGIVRIERVRRVESDRGGHGVLQRLLLRPIARLRIVHPETGATPQREESVAEGAAGLVVGRGAERVRGTAEPDHVEAIAAVERDRAAAGADRLARPHRIVRRHPQHRLRAFEEQRLMDGQRVDVGRIRQDGDARHASTRVAARASPSGHQATFISTWSRASAWCIGSSAASTSA
jgi:hypothetical protein